MMMIIIVNTPRLVRGRETGLLLFKESERIELMILLTYTNQGTRIRFLFSTISVVFKVTSRLRKDRWHCMLRRLKKLRSI